MGKARSDSQSSIGWPQSFRDYDGRQVLLTEERWSHVVAGHPEMLDRIEWIGTALATPNTVHQSIENAVTVSYSHLLPKINLYVTVITDWSSEPSHDPNRIPDKEA